MEIKAYQRNVDDWIKTIGVRYFSELTNMAKKTNRDSQRHIENKKLM